MAAEHFLAKSQTYKRTTAGRIFRIDQVTAQHLRPEFRAGKENDDEVFEAVRKDLAGKGVKIKRTEYALAKRRQRHAYLWLCAGRKRRRELEASLTGQDVFGIKCLKKDKKTSWQALGYPEVPEFASNGVWQAGRPRKHRSVVLNGASRNGSRSHSGSTAVQSGTFLKTLLEQQESLRQETAALSVKVEDQQRLLDQFTAGFQGPTKSARK